MENLRTSTSYPQPSAITSKRKEKDVMKLLVSEYNVKLANEDSFTEFQVKLKGPINSPYEGGFWWVRVILPEQYPFKSPSIGFSNKIFHPNIDESSGSVCLDVINQTWSPMFELVNIFEVFLPQLLLYPNPKDPLNGEAAQLLLKDEKKYNEKIRDFVKRFAQEAHVKQYEFGSSSKEEVKVQTKIEGKEAEIKLIPDPSEDELSETSQLDLEEEEESQIGVEEEKSQSENEGSASDEHSA